MGASCSPARSDGDGAGGVHVARRGAAEVEHLLHDAGAVDGRRGVGHGDDGRVAAERRASGAGLDGLGLLLARLAQVAVDVDEAGADDAAGGVEGAVGAEGPSPTAAMRPSTTTTSAVRSPVASTTRPPLMTTDGDQARAGSSSVEGRGSGSARQAAGRPGRCRSPAAGTGRPCGRRRRCGPGRGSASAGRSATSAAISTPRFMGPGCMTRASSRSSSTRRLVRPKQAVYSRSDGSSASVMRSRCMRSR